MKIDLAKYSTNNELNLAMMLIAQINSYGYEAYAVGGCVRDLVRYELGQTDTPNIHDVDIATNMPIEKLQEKFTTRSNNGEAHGTILVLFRAGLEFAGYDPVPFEVTQFRTDGDYSDGRHPDSVTFAKTFKEDASRRDLTINALGLDADGNVIDYFGGVDDIKNKIIRTVGNANDRFSEDALRIIRALRFAVLFDYKIDDDTRRAMGDEAYRVKKLSAERIRKEFVTVAEKGNFAVFAQLMEMNHVLPYVSALGLITPSILTDSLPKLYRFNKDTGMSASVNKDNLVPLLAIKSFDPEETLKRLCATRDEVRLYKYYRYFMDYLETIEPYGWTWTKLVEFVEGDYKNVLWYGVPFHFSDDFYQQLEIAKFLSQNKPDFKKISERLKESGVKEGSEFGEKYREMVEAEYTKKANMLTKELITTIGRSTVHYKLHYVD
jgi:tRNA nucleotidyltransferase/poly(A) polymerase